MKKTAANPKPAFLVLSGLLLAALSLSAEDKTITLEDIPGPVSLNGDWQFRLAETPAEAMALNDFHSADFDAEGFTSIPVPSNWNMEGFENPHYVNGTASEGFYLYTFEVPEAAADLRTMLYFGGVWVSAEVWVNGENMGRHDSGFTRFGFDVSNVVKPGETNRIAVRVRQQLPNNLFKFDANDDWGLAGIYRDVWLEFVPKQLAITSVAVETDLDEDFKDADLKLKVFVLRDERGDYYAPSPPFDLRTRLTTWDGELVLEDVHTSTVTNPRNGREISITIPVENPRKWTAETPSLYRLRIDLEREGTVLHRWEDAVGFREVDTKGGVFRINGQPVKLRGVNRHDQHPDVGRATRKEHWLQDIQLMKAANMNAIRMSHYPPAEGFLDLCDELGMYVADEIPLGFGGERMDRPEFAEGMLLRLHETILRDRNHPSVIIWDFGNEDPFTALHAVGLKMIKGIDPTRPTLLPFHHEADLPPEVDLLAPHYWKADDYDRLAANAGRPVVTTEYTHALGSRDFGEMEQRWEALTTHPAGAGGFIWLWADQGLRRPVDGRPVLDPMEDKDKYTREGGELVREADAGDGFIYDSHGNYGTDGIVNADRSPQRDYWEVKAVYAPVRILREQVEFEPGQDSVEIPVRNDYDFTNLDAVTFHWTLYADHLPLASGEEVVEAEPHASAGLRIPTGSIEESDTGPVYYVHIEPWRDGRALTRRSVRLGNQRMVHPLGVEAPEGIQIYRDDKQLTVSAGPASYAFNTATGEISRIQLEDRVLAGEAGFAPWRPSTYCERNRYDRVEDAPDWNTFMQGLHPELKDWDVSTNGDQAEIKAVCEYRQDEKNSVLVRYTYRIGRDGIMKVSFTADMELDVPELPEIGLTFRIPAGLNRLIWMGQGLIDSVPGKTAATCFGWWAANPDSPAATGTKSGLEWAKLDYPGGQQLYLHGQPGIRLETDGEDGYVLRVLTHIGGAWTKNGPPENPDWHLDLSKQTKFDGSFTIIPTWHGSM